LAPELIHADKRIRMLHFKVMPTGQLVQSAGLRVLALKLPVDVLMAQFKTEKGQVELLQNLIDLSQRKTMFLDVEQQVPAFTQTHCCPAILPMP